MRELLKAILKLGLLALAAASLAPFLADMVPLLSVAEHFAVQVLVATAALTALALLAHLRFWAMVGGLIVLINLIAVWPFLPMTGEAQAARNAPALRVVSLNVWWRSDKNSETLRYLEDSGADLIGLVEVSPDWKAALKPLERLYPYRADCIGRVLYCEVMLLSKYPFKESYAGRILGAMPTIAWGKIELQGRTITVAVTHLIWPLSPARPVESAATILDLRPRFPDVPLLAQAEQAANLANYLNGLGPDLVVMGDFNSAPWSRIQSAFRDATGLDNVGRLAPTWPAWGPTAIRLPIDHIFTRGAMTATDFAAGPDIGSDHLPVEATILVP